MNLEISIPGTKKRMDIELLVPRRKCTCKICGGDGAIAKNIGEYCYVCLRKYNIEYPEYIRPEQYFMYMKEALKKEFDIKEEI